MSETTRINISKGSIPKLKDCMSMLNINSRQELLDIAIDRLYVNMIDEKYNSNDDNVINLLHRLTDKVDILIERVE